MKNNHIHKSTSKHENQQKSKYIEAKQNLGNGERQSHSIFCYKEWERFWQLLIVPSEGVLGAACNGVGGGVSNLGMQLHGGRSFSATRSGKRKTTNRRRDCGLFLFFRLNTTPPYTHPLLVHHNPLPPYTNFVVFPLIYTGQP